MSAEVKCKKCGNVLQKGNAHCVFCGEELPTETGSLFDRTENSSDIGRNADNDGYVTVEQGKNEQEWKCQDMCSRNLPKISETILILQLA